MSFHSPISLCTPAHKLSHSFQSQSSTSDYFTQSTNTTATQGDPQTLLLDRWKYLGLNLFPGHMSWKTVVAMNRKLDEVERILGWPMPERETDEAKEQELGLGVTNTVNTEHFLRATGEVTTPASDAPERWSPPKADDQTLDSDAALLGRITQAVEQLRQRQHEFKVGG